ncbi:family 43 glycosylhydrolase [Mucilaginibacter ginsenosidivorax]|uniref:Family 43 glycosylhydrolase n=1 Tax=Mucilaginibacter ginsenosidivorax TaxID=862126 RepID=A0A5B8W7N1_9SPHI|nr:family 43 glycosylhydrolase [Mucilaginibacter ginsenosidivorax]QEC79487.1 family 43 glycosylhydrolase [Mucilaginibacter ginsenosidivorax]
MKDFKKCAALMVSILWFNCLMAQNPLIQNQFTADPSVRVFNNMIYLYPSHDIPATPGHGRAGWFCMQDYHVFSSSNLTDWVDHGVIVSQNKVPWADSAAYSMWAPDCIERAGKYYFYFPAPAKSGGPKGFSVGVAVADKPYGPFVPQPLPIAGIHGIDPNVQIDKDGQGYIYWAQGNLYGAKLKANMLELASEPVKLEGFPDKGLKEGPYLFERKGIYYMTYPHVADKTERLEYAMSDNPLGPFKYAGVLMDESASGCWTNHQSVIEFKNQWYLFYHNDDLSPAFDKNRAVRADSLFFNEDGTIRKVIPTLRGIGVTASSKKIQIDRYSAKSEDGVGVEFIDTLNKFKGWKTIFNKTNSWIKYNSVLFGKQTAGYVSVNAWSATGGTLLISTEDNLRKVIARVAIPKGNNWSVVKKALISMPTGMKNIIVQTEGSGRVEVDWISFN